MLSAASLLAITGLFAQTEEGKLLVGAATDLNFGVTSFDGIDDNTTAFSIGGRVGFFVIDNLAIGGNIGFSSTSRGDLSSNTFSIGPGVRYYVNGTFFLGGLFSYGRSSSDNGETESSIDFTTLGFEAGYPIWIVETVAIEPALIYSRNMGSDIVNANSFGLNVGFSLYF